MTVRLEWGADRVPAPCHAPLSQSLPRVRRTQPSLTTPGHCVRTYNLRPSPRKDAVLLCGGGSTAVVICCSMLRLYLQPADNQYPSVYEMLPFLFLYNEWRSLFFSIFPKQYR